MSNTDLLHDTGKGSDTTMIPGPERVADLVQNAQEVLKDHSGGVHYVRVTGEPVLVAPDITSQVRLPDLIPEKWQPDLTDMIMQAVEHG